MGINYRRPVLVVILGTIWLLLSACAHTGGTADQTPNSAESYSAVNELPPLPVPEPEPAIPDPQAELVDGRFRTSTSPIASFDFLNHSYPLPRGWQNPDGSDAKLENGRLAPISEHLGDDMTDEGRAKARSERRIGLSHVVTKYFDITGDGQDEAIVVLKIETGGNALPQIIYIFEWLEKEPHLMWHFRTGDRSDGGLKDIRPEGGQLVLELYGQDRFMLGEVETGKITGDEVQLCCPTHFTRTVYKWNGKNFIRQGDRLTYLTADPTAAPIINFGDIMNDPVKSKKFLEANQKPSRN